MKCKIIILLGFSVMTTSCEKITNVKLIDGISTGKLSYKLNDDSGKGLAGVKVSLYDSQTVLNASSPNPVALVATITTDQEGIAYFSDLLAKNYLVATESPIVNKVEYNPYEFVQVVADSEKKKIVKVSDFSGLLNFKVQSNDGNRTPLKNIGIVAYPYHKTHPNSATIPDFIREATLKGLTDENGFLSIKVPSNTDFSLIIYNLTTGYFDYGHGIHTVEKDGKASVEFSIPPF